MIDKMDWAAAMSSDIFREYVANELKKEAENEEQAAIKALEAAAGENIYNEFDDFERRINKSEFLKERFKQAKEILLTHPELAEKVDSRFINGIMMLELKD